jgi:metal-responsive CopG/Arc/MetJ family transcriptional regulator
MASIKTAISVEERLLDEVSRHSKRMGVSRSRFFADAAREYLARFDRESLIKRINEANKEGADASERRYLKTLKRNLGAILKDEPW